MGSRGMMKLRLRDLKIGLRISIFTSTAVVLLLTAMGIYLFRVQSANILQEADTNLTEEVNNLKEIVELQIREREIRVASGIDVAMEIFRTSGQISRSEERRVGKECRSRWWPEQERKQIGHITNGVHIPSWLAQQMGQLYDRHFPAGWIFRMGEPEGWQNIHNVDPVELWETDNALKNL